MAPDYEGDDEVGSAGPPLPPDDRLWRHPSELSQLWVTGTGVAAGSQPARRSPVWAVGLIAALTGATLSAAVIGATNALSPRVVEREVVEKVALTPVVSSPMLAGERGVAAVAALLSPAIVRLEVKRPGSSTVGSGVLYRDDGLVLASAQVVLDATSIMVLLSDGRSFAGRLLGLDWLTGVALIDIDGNGLPVAVLGTADGLRIGDPTIALGSPLEPGGAPVVTTGVISAVDRQIAGPQGEALHGMIQIDASIPADASGGALVDQSGALIGIVTPVAAQDGGRFGFATPIDLAHRVAAQLLTTGHMTHCWLGVEGDDLSGGAAAAAHIAGGALVQRVAPNSPAERAGITRADVITEMDGTQIRSISNLVVQLRGHVPGDRVVIGYWRLGRHVEVSVLLTARP